MRKNRETTVGQIEELQKRVRAIYKEIESLEKEKIEINNRILNLCPHDEIMKEFNEENHGYCWDYICTICGEYIKKHNINFDKIKLI